MAITLEITLMAGPEFFEQFVAQMMRLLVLKVFCPAPSARFACSILPMGEGMKKQTSGQPSTRTPVMTVKEVSDYLRVHPSTIYRLLKRGEIPAFRINGDWRFHLTAIEKWRSQMEVR